jgi:diguanylate cyclase (GGDEF)-like protein
MVDTRDGPDARNEEVVWTTIRALPVKSRVFEETKRPYLIVIAGAHMGELHKIAKPRMTIGRGSSADIQIEEEGLSREHVEILLEERRVLIRDLNSTNGTFRNGERVDSAEIADGDKVSLGPTTVLKLSFKDGMDEAYEAQLYRAATRDALTLAFKREFFLERLESEIAFSVRHHVPLAMILWDLDHFKAINDQHGHPAGDRLLAATGRAVAGSIRREDVFGRYGGEEFALMCRDMNHEVACAMAERLRRMIEEIVVDVGEIVLRVTASFGVAVCPSDGILASSQLLAAADAAMYRAKALGRNRVAAAPATQP